MHEMSIYLYIFMLNILCDYSSSKKINSILESSTRINWVTRHGPTLLDVACSI